MPTIKEWSQEFETLVNKLCEAYGWEHEDDRDNAYETISILKPLIESNTQAQAQICFEAGVERGWEQAQAYYHIDTS